MRALAALLIATGCARSADLMFWYPLLVGSRWVYDCESRSGDRRRPDVARWREIVTVKAHIERPEGLVIVREVEIRGAANPPGGFRRPPYLWRGNCLYPLYPKAWDAAKRAFTPQFPTYLAQVSPDFCFPLTNGATWQGGGDWKWRVDGRGPVKGGPRDVAPDTIRLVEDQQGGPLYVWFRKGLGPVAGWTSHRRTYTENFERLVER